MYGFPVRGNCCRGDRWGGFIDDGTSVSALVDVSVGTHLVACYVSCGIGIHFLCKGDKETVRLGLHFKDLKGNGASKVTSFQGKTFASSGTPTTVSAPNKHTAIRSEADSYISGSEFAPERKSCSLIDAVDFFERNTQDSGHGLFTDKKLVGKWAKLACGIACDTCWGVAELAVRKHGSGRYQLRYFLTLNGYPASTFRGGRLITDGTGKAIILVAYGVADKSSDRQRFN